VFHVELEPGEPGQAHLRSESQQPALLALLDPPEVKGVADEEPPGVAPATTQPHAAHQPVEPAADPPGQREGVPADVAADPLHDPPQLPRRRGRRPGALVDVQAAAGPVGIGR
jgi:hypothetical protein